MKLHERLLQSRERLGLSQEEVAKALGITRQSVSKYERGIDDAKPKERHWAIYERILAKPPGWMWSIVMREKAENDGLDVSVIENYPILASTDERQVELAPEIYELALEIQQYASPAMVADIKSKLKKMKSLMD